MIILGRGYLLLTASTVGQVEQLQLGLGVWLRSWLSDTYRVACCSRTSHLLFMFTDCVYYSLNHSHSNQAASHSRQVTYTQHNTRGTGGCFTAQFPLMIQYSVYTQSATLLLLLLLETSILRSFLTRNFSHSHSLAIELISASRPPAACLSA